MSSPAASFDDTEDGDGREGEDEKDEDNGRLRIMLNNVFMRFFNAERCRATRRGNLN